VIAGAAWFAMVVFFLDFDTGGYTDLIPGLAFVALGIGLLGDSLMSDRRRIAFAGAVTPLVVLNLTSFGGIGVVFPAADTPEPVSMDDLRTNERALELAHVPDDAPDIRYMYWHRMKPETCHYRLSLLEVSWLKRAGPDASSGCSDLAEVRVVLNR
jgi:hypothetical protein